MKIASEYLRKSDKEKEVAYEKALDIIIDVARSVWNESQYIVQTDYEKKLMNGKLFGTRFAVDVKGANARDVYHLVNDALLDRDTLSERFQKALENGDVMPLGDAVVVPHGAIINPSKSDFEQFAEPNLGITFNLVLPEDIPDDYDMKEKEEESEDAKD